MTYSFGIVWDSYTPAVEGQLVRDVMALKSASKQALQVVCPTEAPYKLLKGLGVTPIVGPQSLAKLWIVYQTTPNPVEAPSFATEVVNRVLYQVKGEGVLDTSPHSGYYLKPQGRDGSTSTILNRPSPSSIGQTDPYVTQRWG